MYLLLLVLTVSLVGLMIPSAFAENVPEWVKNTAGWWAADQIDDSSFLQGIQYLIKEGIMVISPTETSESTGSQEVPGWIKNNAGWWADGQIDDGSFVSGIQWLISNGIIVVEEKLIHTEADFRVAFIGDQGYGPNSFSVLELIKDEGAQMVLHQGDLDYEDDPDKWDSMISNVLGDDFPYFVSIGGHDVLEWNKYQQKLYDRLKKNPDAKCIGDLGVKSACTYKGLFFVLVGPGAGLPAEVMWPKGSEHDSFIENQLSNNKHIWRICSWALNMTDMQIGGEKNRDDTGWEVYNACKNGGAIIATAHEHSYQRTKTLIDIENQIIDNEWSKPGKLKVDEGSTFVFVSGLGGHRSIYDQNRCLPFSYPYGCNGEWASIYTYDQGAAYGALFCTFNVGGQPSKAYCYFKNIDGRIIDAFTITSFLGTYPNNTNLIDVNMSGMNLTDDDLANTIIADTNLSNAILVGADLSNTVIIGTTLTRADLTSANLTGVTLIGNDLTGTILRGADLTGANLFGVDLSGMDLTGTILRGADLTSANLTGVTLIGNDLTGTILRAADLTGANLFGVDLSGMDLTVTTLKDVDLSGMDLTGTILRGANLIGANLFDVDLSGMDLTGTILRGADLSGMDLTGTILRGADLSNSTLPDDILSKNNFDNTILNGVNLSGKDLSYSTFRNANFDDTNMKNTYLFGAVFLEVDLTMIKSLTGANLVSASFTHSNLSGVNLAGTILKGSNFYNSNLSGQDFTVISQASTMGSIFIQANLSNSNFESVDLSPQKIFSNTYENKAYLKNSSAKDIIKDLYGDFSNIFVISTEVRGNDLVVNYIYYNSFSKANLENVNFKNADLRYANFYSADLANADLSGADLRNAFLGSADLSNADLSGADLRNAFLGSADLSRANLEGANLQGALLDDAILSNANLKCLNHPICLDE